VEEAIEVVDNIDLEGEEEPVKEKAEKSKFRFRKSKK
jgi:hypothetical protein